MNMIGVRSTLHTVLAEHGVDAAAVDPWFFPTPAQYGAILHEAGFRVEYCGTDRFVCGGKVLGSFRRGMALIRSLLPHQSSSRGLHRSQRRGSPAGSTRLRLLSSTPCPPRSTASKSRRTCAGVSRLT